MSTFVVRPERLAPAELDERLARGWFRIGQTLMTCRMIVFNGAVRSTIWTRLDLQKGPPGANARKLINRALRRFRITHGPAVIDGVREHVYARYVKSARGERSQTLTDFRFGDRAVELFDTRELAIWDGERLVAFSWFDVGADAVQSLVGAYDPDYKRDSLGVLTLLLEAERARELGLRWFYPGYVLPRDPAMDYKLRVGRMEFLDAQTGAWRPWEELTGPFDDERMQSRLQEVVDALVMRGFVTKVAMYGAFDAPAWDERFAACMDQPWVVELPVDDARLIAVTWDVVSERYRVVPCTRAVAWVADSEGKPERAIDLLVRGPPFAEPETAEAAAQIALRR